MSTPLAILRFKGIELVSKTMIQSPDPDTIIPTFHFHIIADLRLNHLEKILIIMVTIKIKEPNKELDLAELSIACAYEVENFEEAIIQNENGSFDVPAEADALVRSESISTARGILFSEFRGTYLSTAIMPIINIKPSEQKSSKQTEKE